MSSRVLAAVAAVMLLGSSIYAGQASFTEAVTKPFPKGGTIRMTRLALPLLEASPEAAVVFMSSATAVTAVPGLAVYAATKAALHSLARSLRRELPGRGIRVVEVLPPVVDTALAGHLDVAKTSPSAVADAMITGLARDRSQIAVGPIRLLIPLARIAPRLADHLVLRALGPLPEDDHATRGR